MGEGGEAAKEKDDMSNWFGTRAFTLYPSTSTVQFDYLTQQPVGEAACEPATTLSSSGAASMTTTTRKPLTAYPPPRGELMLGGGFLHQHGCTGR